MPKPPEENVSLSGWLLRSATSSATECAGTDGLTTRTLYETDALMTGSKSVSKRYEIFGTSDGAATDGTVIA